MKTSKVRPDHYINYQIWWQSQVLWYLGNRVLLFFPSFLLPPHFTLPCCPSLFSSIPSPSSLPFICPILSLYLHLSSMLYFFLFLSLSLIPLWIKSESIFTFGNSEISLLISPFRKHWSVSVWNLQWLWHHLQKI